MKNEKNILKIIGIFFLILMSFQFLSFQQEENKIKIGTNLNYSEEKILNLTDIPVLSFESEINSIRYNNYPSNCSNKSMIETAHCLGNYIDGIFKYVNNSPDIHKTFNYIKQNGGDCYDYSNLYNQWLKELGFKSYIQQNLVKQEKGIFYKHQYTKLTGETGYCILDMDVVICFEYK